MVKRNGTFFVVVAVIACLLLGFSPGTTRAQGQKSPISVVNRSSKREFKLSVYNELDNVKLITCQTLKVPAGKTGYIEPKTTSRIKMPFEDHCGLYTRLDIDIVYTSGNPASGMHTEHHASFRKVPWGAVIVIDDGGARCEGC